MSMPLDNSIVARSIFSNDVRREVLWNVLEPGDPYDIRNSMIAKMPGDKKIFMGSHLELICLLQTAEIERLSEFLYNYRLKLRDMERGQLDRHSYEIQIKELMQQLDEEEAYKSENAKLKEFISKQGSQIQNLKQGTRDQRGYDQKSLERVNQLVTENTELRLANDRFRLQALTFKARVEALQQARIKQIQDLRLNYARYSKESYEGNISAYRLQSEGQLRQLEFELKRAKDINDLKTTQLAKASNENEMMQKRLIELTAKGGNYSLIEKQIVQYETQIRLFTTENDKLIISLRDYANRLSQSQFTKGQIQKKRHQYELMLRQNQARLRQKDNELSNLRQTLKRSPPVQMGRNQQQLLQFESRINILTRQNLQLNQTLRNQVRLENQLRQEISTLALDKSKLGLVYQQNADLKNASAHTNQLQRRTAELENRNVLLSRQIQRLTLLLTNRDAELMQAKTLFFENQSLKTKIREMEAAFNIKYHTDLTRIATEYEQKINESRKITGNQVQSSLQVYRGQIEGLKEHLRNKAMVQEKLRVRIYELQGQSNRSNFQSTARLKHLQDNLVVISRQNQSLKSKTRQLMDIQRKLIQFQNRNAQMERQCQRLSHLLKSKEEQVFSFKLRLNEVEGMTQHSQYDLNRQTAVYEINLKNSRIENEELRRAINQIVNETSKKAGHSIQEIERLNQILRKIGDQRNQLAQENQLNKQKLMNVLQQNEDLRRQVAQSENQRNNLVHDYSNRLKIVGMDNESLKKQLGENISVFNNYQLETSRMTIAEKEAMARISQENEVLRGRLRQSELKPMSVLEAGKGNDQIPKIKEDQLTLLESKYGKLWLEHESLIQHVKDYEALMKTKFQEERAAKISNYDSTIQKLQQENQELRGRLNEEESRLNQQLDKIRNNFKAIAQQNESIRRIVAQKEILTSNIQQQADAKIANYQSSIANLTGLNEQQSRKLVERELNVSQKTEQLERLQNRYKNLEMDWETAKRQLRLLEETANSNLEADVTRRFQEYQLTVDEYTRRLNESEQRQATLTQQRLKDSSTLNAVLAENVLLKNKLQEFELSIGAFETEVNRRVALYEGNISRLEEQKKMIISKLHEAEQTNQAKTSQEGDVNVLSLEMAGYRERQKLFIDQSEDLKRRLLEKEEQMSALDSKYNNLLDELGRLTSNYDRDILQLRSQNQHLVSKQRLAEQTISDINSEENTKIQQNWRVVTEQNEDLRRQIIQQNASMELLKQQIISPQQSLGQDSTTNELEQRMQALVQQIDQLKLSLNQETNKNVQFQNRLRDQGNMIAEYERQIQSLNSLIQATSDNKHTYYASVSEQQIDAMKRENQYLKSQIEELESLSSRSDERLLSLNQQIARLNQILNARQAEYDELNSLSHNQQHEINNLRRQYRELEESSRRPPQTEPTSNNTFYQITIDALKSQNRRLAEMNESTYAEIERLNLVIRQNQQALQMTNKQAWLNLTYQNIQRKPSPNTIQPDQPIIQIDQQRESKYLAAESNIAYLKQTIDTIQEQLRVRTVEAHTILQQFQQYQQSVHFNFEAQVSKRSAAFQDELNGLHRENEQLKRQLITKMSSPANEEQNQIISLMQEINRLNIALKTKENQNQNLQSRNRHLLYEQESLRRRLEQSSDTSYQKLQYQRQIEEYVIKIEGLQLALDGRTDQLERVQFKLREYEERKETLKQDIRRLSGNSREEEEVKPKWTSEHNNVSSLTLERDSLLTRIAEFESRIDLMTIQYDRLNLQHKSTIEELENLRRTAREISQPYNSDFSAPHAYNPPINNDYEAAKRHIAEYQLSIKKLYKQFERLQGIIDNLRSDKKGLGEKNRALSEEVTRLIRENKQLEQDIKNVQLRLSDESALQKRINEHMALVVILCAEIQSLRARLKQRESQHAQPTYRASLSPQVL